MVSTIMNITLADFCDVSDSPLNNESIKHSIIHILYYNNHKNTFNFIHFDSIMRNKLYISFTHLQLDFIKIRGINNNVQCIQININDNIRQSISINIPNVYPTFPSYNLTHKLQLSDYIYEIKDKITDSMFKNIMDTLYKIN